MSSKVVNLSAAALCALMACQLVLARLEPISSYEMSSYERLFGQGRTPAKLVRKSIYSLYLKMHDNYKPELTEMRNTVLELEQAGNLEAPLCALERFELTNRLLAKYQLYPVLTRYLEHYDSERRSACGPILAGSRKYELARRGPATPNDLAAAARQSSAHRWA